jgi:hypothetical protein
VEAPRSTPALGRAAPAICSYGSPPGDPPGRSSSATGGWTLHQLRDSAITHLAGQNVALPLLMAKSRHTSLRSLQKYARPGVDAVAKLTADHTTPPGAGDRPA